MSFPLRIHVLGWRGLLTQPTIPATEFRGDECSSLSCSSKSRCPMGPPAAPRPAVPGMAVVSATPASGALERGVLSCPIVRLRGFENPRAGGDFDITLPMGTASLTRPHSRLVAEKPILSLWAS